MMKQLSQAKQISDEIMSLLDQGMKDKQAIFTKVVANLGVPRPTVRRVSRDLRMDLQRKVLILSSGMQADD